MNSLLPIFMKIENSKCIVVGGANPPLELLKKCEKAFGVDMINGYGQTETCGVTATALPSDSPEKKSIAGFKIREGMPLGLKVTLRRRRMYEFVDRFLNSALPRIRDFQGISRNCFDGRGNCSIGIREHAIFPEIDYNSIDRIRGLQVIIGTTAKNDNEGMRFLELLGMPFVRVT